MRLSVAALAALCLFHAPALATDWQTLAKADVDAAYQLLKDNHPGAVPETGDRDFVFHLEAAHKKALERARHVKGPEGIFATLGEFANSMGDGHIRTKAVIPQKELHWAGIVMAKRGPDWLIAGGDAAHASAVGGRLILCDGIAADALAQTRLRFIADVGAEFSLVNKAGWLLVDDGNPFLKSPASCVFEKDGVRRTERLTWRSIAREEFEKTYLKPPYGAAGFGLRKAGAGYWIAMQGLDGRAQPVLDAVKLQREAVRSAPFVVIDLRGNGGGNSDYSDQLVTELWGEYYVNAAVGETGGGPGCGTVYRASPGNIAGFAEMIEKRFMPQGDKAGEKQYASAIVEMEKAQAQGQALTGAPLCQKPNVARPAIKPALQGQAFVLTDSRCFSSCLIAVETLREFGAEQVGLATAYNTNYSENREITLPSGLATFATQQAITTGAPARVGPFVPARVFTGDITDNAAVERWVLTEIAPK